ncbi:MAG: HD domain-containing protein [Prevotellaceae bacterium]|nr:HD domain-containing protein [Prevotellaceae bacterium]MDO4932695.1 HD domain-containing protein [Prevotellaceae bacterium]
MNYQDIIDHYFPANGNAPLREILMTHSRSVAELARDICTKHPELGADADFVYEAAMLHDIGIVRCDAPGIHCFGTEPYIRHGVLGAAMLEEYAGMYIRDTDITPYARVCARHTGTGLTAESIREQQLPLPETDLVPESVEERIICYADKFFSKTRLDSMKTFGQAEKSLMKFGQKGVTTFREWRAIFGPAGTE